MHVSPLCSVTFCRTHLCYSQCLLKICCVYLRMPEMLSNRSLPVRVRSHASYGCNGRFLCHPFAWHPTCYKNYICKELKHSHMFTLLSPFIQALHWLPMWTGITLIRPLPRMNMNKKAIDAFIWSLELPCNVSIQALNRDRDNSC